MILERVIIVLAVSVSLFLPCAGCQRSGGSLSQSSDANLTVGDEYDHLWYVSGSVVAIDESSNELVVDLSDRGEGHFEENPVAFSCDTTICPVEMFSIGQEVTVSYLWPCGAEGERVANDVTPLDTELARRA